MTDVTPRHDTLLAHLDTALGEFGGRVQQVGDDRWEAPTPCTDWDVRALVNHLVNEMLWAPPLLDGRTIAEVGDRFDGDVLGDDPVAAWSSAADAARDSAHGAGALDRTVHLSFGDTPADEYVWQLTADLTVHAWDLARGAGLSEVLPPSLCNAVLEKLLPQADMLAGSGVFGTPIDVPDGADDQTRLLGLVGRRR
jgi:uncharacterized protein (TIGR03086 family)